MEIQETRAQLEQELQQIAKWEKDQRGSSWMDRIGRIPFAVLDRLTPRFIRDKLGVALNEIGRFIPIGWLVSDLSKGDDEKACQSKRTAGCGA